MVYYQRFKLYWVYWVGKRGSLFEAPNRKSFLTNLFSFVTLTGDVEASQEVTAFQFRVSKRGVRYRGMAGVEHLWRDREKLSPKKMQSKSQKEIQTYKRMLNKNVMNPFFAFTIPKKNLNHYSGLKLLVIQDQYRIVL